MSTQSATAEFWAHFSRSLPINIHLGLKEVLEAETLYFHALSSLSGLGQKVSPFQS